MFYGHRDYTNSHNIKIHTLSQMSFLKLLFFWKSWHWLVILIQWIECQLANSSVADISIIDWTFYFVTISFNIKLCFRQIKLFSNDRTHCLMPIALLQSVRNYVNFHLHFIYYFWVKHLMSSKIPWMSNKRNFSHVALLKFLSHKTFYECVTN